MEASVVSRWCCGTYAGPPRKCLIVNELRWASEQRACQAQAGAWIIFDFFSWLSCKGETQKPTRGQKEKPYFSWLLVFFVVHIFNFFAPARAARKAFVALRGWRTSETNFWNARRCKIQTLCKLNRSFAFYHVSRKTNGEVSGKLAVLWNVLRNKRVFTRRNPELNQGKILCNLRDLLQVKKGLNVTGIMPAEKAAWFCAFNGFRHCFNPKGIWERLKTFFVAILHSRKTVITTHSVASWANGIFNFRQFCASNATQRRRWPRLARHFARRGEIANQFKSFFCIHWEKYSRKRERHKNYFQLKIGRKTCLFAWKYAKTSSFVFAT